jgi:hemerythrin-like domain-containing protein
MKEDSGMNPVGILTGEHLLIDRMVDLLQGELENISQGKKVDLIFFDGAIDFTKNYADLCHHGKEESLLFEALDMKRLLPEHKELMDSLVMDHVEHRNIIISLEAARERHLKAEADTVGQMLTACKRLAEFYPGHMAKEEKGLFIPSMEYFSQREQEEMVKKFWEFDKDLLLAKYLNFMDRYDR